MAEAIGIVTNIQELSGHRYSVYLDEQFAFVLYKGELSSFNIKAGEPISTAAYDKIYHRILPKRAMKRCLNLLKTRAYTEKGLRAKLKEGRYPSEIIDQAIDYVKSLHYIDDFDYACDYVRCNKFKSSRRDMEVKLRERGISAGVLEQAFSASYEEEEEERLQYELAEHLLKKKGYDPEHADRKEKQKLYAYLMRKGIPTETVRRLLDCFYP